ncbi:MAG TPA: hypothetical protein VNH40_13875 [Gaiellaceae bacterium]|nr:hypothetical protein [Gaiellaceae bacterium]
MQARRQSVGTPRRTKISARTGRTLVAINLALVGLFVLAITQAAGRTNATSCPGSLCSVTIDARDFATQAPLTSFSFLVNEDNTKLPSDPNSLSTESNSPIVAEGGDGHPTVQLPAGRYLVSVRSLDHKMWGAYFTLPDDAGDDGTLTVPVELTEQSDAHPLPLGKIRVFVFNDNAWTNGAPDTEEGGLNGFQVGLEEQTGSAVTVDYNNDPLCGGVCKTAGAGDNAGFVEIPNLGPATYFIDVHPPDTPCNSNPDSRWYQTTTIDGGFNLIAPTEEGADGTGAPGEQLWEPPNNRTAYWFGFVCAPQAFSSPGTGEITGTARNWVEWTPYTTGTFTDPVENPFVALSDASTDQTVYVGRGDGAGNFDIQGVPAGDYNLAVWDEQLSYIMRFTPVTVAAGGTANVNQIGDDGSEGLGVSRWFGWLDGTVYKDLNNNGQFDAGVDAPIPNTDMDQRWRDGSIKESTFTDAAGHYEYPTAEGGALGRWFVNEQGFARFSAFPGASVHDEHTDAVTPSCQVDPPATPANPCVPNSLGGGLLMNQLLLEGHRATVDWGKRDYPAGTPGQIVGITYFATTRNEFEAYKQAHEDYEPAIPDVTVYLETLGTDGLPNTADDVVVNRYVTDHWQQPSTEAAPDTQTCNPLRDFFGNDVTNQFNPLIGSHCLEVPLTGEQTKEGAFDGGYAFADYCPNGYDLLANDGTCVNGTDPVPLVAGTYITHAVMPTDPNDTRPCNTDVNDPNVSTAKGDVPGDGEGCLYRPVKEEDVNVDLGDKFTPAIPPPLCTGDDHLIDQSTLTTRSTYYGKPGAHAPLCDKRLVVLQNQQNANADFNLMTNFPTDPNGTDSGDTHTGDVAEPGRIIGQVFDDINFDRNQSSVWYGEPTPLGNIPVGVYARVDTVPNTSCPDASQPGIRCFDGNTWRLIKTLTTSADGAYEILLPSTETFNCPIPQGPCPGMYLVTVDDPGTKAHPNANYNPDYLTATTPAEVWPGLTDQLDTPIDPISGTACEDPAGGTTPDPSDPARPDVLQVVTPVIAGTAISSSRRITIYSDFIGSAGPTGANGGTVVLTDDRNPSEVTTLTRGGSLSGSNGGIVSWTPGAGSTPDTIVVQLPAINTTTFRPGPKQLQIVTSAANGRVSSVNGITVHVLGSNGSGADAVSYNPPIVNVPAPPPVGANPHALQDAIDGAAAGSLLVLSEGTYNENVLVWKKLRIQGLGPGGVIGAHELQGRDPEDPRFNVKGSIIDGRFFQENATGYDATVAAHVPYVLPPFEGGSASTVLRGADVTFVAKATTDYDAAAVTGDSAAFNGARIDGVGLVTGHGDGAGGIQLQAQINNLQVTNNVLESNGGIFAGGIGIGQPYVHGQHNFDVRVANDKLIGNGGLTTSGGLGIFYGSNNYEVAHSTICSNFSPLEYGGGMAHIGKSPNGSIHDNRIYYNESGDSGAGIAVMSELPVGGGLGDGSGAVSIDRNLIQSNTSVGDDGGGIFVLDSLDQPISIRNNMIVNNVAADMGAGITLDDASNVRIVSNTIANNQTTGSSENSAVGVPHAAGLAAEANDLLWQDDPRHTDGYDFSNPVALFDNIFWNNDAMTLDGFGPGAALVDQGFIDFEVRGTTNDADTFTPRYSLLTNGQILGPNGVQHALPESQGNLVGQDPLFVTPFVNELTVSGSRLDPQQAAVSITGTDPPVGLTGDYHLTTDSPAIDQGAGLSDLSSPPPSTQNGRQTPTGASVIAPCSTEALTALSSSVGSNSNLSSISVVSKAGFPTSFPFYVEIDSEIFRVTGDSGATGWSVQRAQLSTSRSSHASGSLVKLVDPAYPADFDGDFRPQLRFNARARTPWDIGADELPGTATPRLLTIPGVYDPPGPQNNVEFNWNNANDPPQLKCSASTETRR